MDCSLELARSLPNDQNELLDNLALKGSKSSFCQVQLCIKVVLFFKSIILGSQIAMYTSWGSFLHVVKHTAHPTPLFNFWLASADSGCAELRLCIPDHIAGLKQLLAR